MTNHGLRTSEDIPPLTKRKRSLAAVAQDVITSEDDDNVADGMDICDIIDESHRLQHKKSATAHALHALGETIRNTLLEINEIREQNRERRHKELLEVLTIMAQQHECDSEKSKIVKTKINNIPAVHIKEEYLSNTSEQTTNNYIIEENAPDAQPPPSNSTTILENKISPTATTTLREQDLKQLPENTASIVETATNKNTNVSSVHIQVTTKNSNKASPVIIGKGQVGKVKSVFAVKQNSKEELQKMRAQMLEFQRKKMEDRERKKRELQQRLQNNS